MPMQFKAPRIQGTQLYQLRAAGSQALIASVLPFSHACCRYTYNYAVTNNWSFSVNMAAGASELIKLAWLARSGSGTALDW